MPELVAAAIAAGAVALIGTGWHMEAAAVRPATTEPTEGDDDASPLPTEDL
jgi:hypothetical protein